MTINPPLSGPTDAVPAEAALAMRQLRRQSYWVFALGLAFICVATGLNYFAVRQHQKAQTEWSQHNQQTIVFNETLAQFERAISYGGLIKNFNNFVLRKDKDLYGPLIEKNLADCFQLLDQLESISTTASQDLITLRAALNLFKTNYTQVRLQIGEGNDTALIDAAIQGVDATALAATKSINNSIREHSQAIILAAEQKNQRADAFVFASDVVQIFSVILAVMTLLFYLRRITASQQINMQQQIMLEQKNAELAGALHELKTTEERYVVALEGNGDGVWDWDLAANKVHLSPRWKAMLGYADYEIGTDLSEWSSRLHPSDSNRVIAEVQANLEGKTESFTSEHRVLCKDGSYLWVLDRGKVVLRDIDGKPLRMVGTHTDIAAQKIAMRALEAALRDSSALLDALNMHAIISVADNAGNITDVNQAFCNISGYTREELLGKSHRIVNSGVQSRQFWIDMWADISNGKPWRNTVCNRAKNGAHYWVDTFIAPFMNAEGKVEKYISIRTDITSAKQQETALNTAIRDNTALLDALNMHAIISVADKAGNIIDANQAFCNISGYSREELLGKNHRIVNSGVQSRQFWIDMWADISSGKPWRNTVCNRAKNGTHYWVDTFIAPFINADGSIEKYISIRTDITLAKQQEAKLQSARDQLEKAADVAEMGIWVWDLKSNAIEWNARMHNIYESPPEVRKSGAYYDYWCSRVHPKDIAFVEERLQFALQGQSTYNPIFRIINNQGETRYIQASGFVEHDETGKPFQMMGINRDITQQYETEDVLRKAKQAADDASNAKSEFLANMSHELRTPMNAILGMTTLLKKTELNNRQLDYAQKTEGAACSLLGLLNDILDLSKAEAGKMLLDPHPFLLDQVLRDLSVILSTNVGKKPVEMLFDIAADVQSKMVGDAMRLQQVLLNLCSNAIKFTERGSVVLKIEAQQKSATAVTLKFQVRDTGIGIAPENHARIFSGFTQAEASTTRRFGGTGLGIAISQRLVNLMGGQLELTSTLGEGSCFFFSVTLPLAGVDHKTTATDVVAEKGLSGSVLVVDDSPIALDIIAQLCESLGWHTDRASSGEQALQLIKQHTQSGKGYRAVFVDWQMPGMDGWQTCQAIHAMDISPTSPVVVMVTAHDREVLGHRSETEQALIDGYLVKPVTASMLVNAVADACGLAPAPSANRDPAANKEPRLKGMKILLAEDNLNNQQIAYELLEAEGAIVEIANNGQEAVDRVAKAPALDVVLMDLQMPVMDGLTATKHIRKKLGLIDLPIVAMTANAMQSDKDACIQAGMNDHVGKPFDLHNLIHVLRLRAGWEISQAAKPESTPVVDAPYLNAAMAAKVDITSALERLGGAEELYVRMFPMFLANLKALPTTLLKCLENQDYLQASQQLHSLKGLAGTLGVKDLAAQAMLAEKQLAGDITAAAAGFQIEHINAAISEMLPNLEAFLSALQPPMAAPEVPTRAITSLDSPALLATLNSLLNQLKNSDMAATQTAAQLLNDFGGVIGEQVEPLKAAMDNLDFAQAAECVLVLLTHLHSEKDKGND